MGDVLRNSGSFPVTLAGTVTRGEPISHNGTNWVRADCNFAAGPLPAMAFALQSGVSGDQIQAATEILFQTTGLTADGNVYLSGTAGEVTQTLPTGVDDLVQFLGRAISTTLVWLRCNPHLMQVFVPPIHVEATAAPTLAATGSDFMGVGLLAAADAVHGNTRVPRNAYRLVAASSYHSGVVALDASDTYTFDVSACHDGDAENAATDGITATALTTADDTMDEDDISSAFNGSGIIEPGKVLGLDWNKAAEGSGGDDPVIYGCALTYLCY